MTFRTESLLDDVGWRILLALQADARLSFSALGRRVGLSPPAVAERVRRLEEAGIIRSYRVDLNLEKAGCPITAIIRVSTPEPQFARLKALAVELREVLECHHVTGADSLVLKVAATSVGHLEKVIEQLGRYGTPTTAIVLSSPVTKRVVDGWPASPQGRTRTRKVSTSRPANPPPR
jgi:Lrp/AsnC family transcriptional regulator, leucine-responsive regulatory protein